MTKAQLKEKIAAFIASEANDEQDEYYMTKSDLAAFVMELFQKYLEQKK